MASQETCTIQYASRSCKGITNSTLESTNKTPTTFTNKLFPIHLKFSLQLLTNCILLRYLKDFFISMIDLSWSATLLCFAASFVVSWLVFAGLWYALALSHGDLQPREDWPANHSVCVDNIHDFTSCFLFSLETQHTIGYSITQ